MFKKLATALVIASAVTTVQLPLSFDVNAAEAKQALLLAVSPRSQYNALEEKQSIYFTSFISFVSSE